MTPLEKAKRVGTLNEIDRSKQYDETDPHVLLRAVNEAWTKIRSCEKQLKLRDAAIVELNRKLKRSQIVNVALTSIITTLALKGLEFLFAALR